MTTLGQELRRLREERGVSQAHIGRMIGINPTDISRWESGARLPRMRNVARLAAVLCLTDDELAQLVRLTQWED